MKNLIILFSLFSLAAQGCKKNSENYLYAVVVKIAYSNAENEDLLNPAHPNSIKADNIEIYYLKNGEKIHINNPDLDNPKNFFIAKLADGKYYFHVVVSNIPDEKNISTTYIEVKDEPVDTLTAQLRISKTITAVTQVWYNDTLKWDGKTGDPTFAIIK